MNAFLGVFDGALVIGTVVAAVILAIGMRIVAARQDRRRRDPRRSSII